ncbi:Translation initiation factor eIF-2B subunit gamma [Naganishia albida]|nr:Translation initiation factor eIF-2B subunit gamma [Naganishia albida]
MFPATATTPSRSAALFPGSKLAPNRNHYDPDFQAVIFCGYGESLYPLTQGENAIPKALLPIGDEVMIDRVLAWVEESGIVDVLLLCPSSQMVAITNHLRAAWPPASDVPTDKKSSHPPSSATHAAHPQTTSSLASRRRNPGDSSRLRIEVHGLDERETMETLIPSDPAVAASNGGPTRDDSCTSSSSESEDSDAFLPLSPESVGTARILRRWRDWIRSDFVVLPCDISPPPSLPLVKLLNRHRNQTGSLVTSLWYEKSEVELRDSDAPESVLVGYDKKSQELLMVQPLEELEDDLELRISLLNRAPTLSLTTNLMDAHVYVFRRPVLDLMMSKDPRDLESIKENLVPWLVKGGWQDGVRAKWNQILNHTSDPLAVALAKSTVASLSLTTDPPADPRDYFESTNATSPSSPAKTPGETLLDFKYNLKPGHAGDKRKSYQRPAPGDELRCAMVIYERPLPEVAPVAPTQNQKGRGQQMVEKEKDVEPPLMRGNTVAVYWELNRQFLRAMPPNLANLPARHQPGAPPSNTSGPSTPAGTDAKPPPPVGNVDPKAQVSADTLLAASTRVGERTSIKKCIIGRHCVLGKNVKLTNCVIWDYVVIADGAKIENTILCNNVRIGEKAQIKDCELGAEYEVEAGADLKGERLTAGEEA